MSRLKLLLYNDECSYCMVCAPVREDSPRALASELLPIQTQNHIITSLLHQHALALYA